MRFHVLLAVTLLLAGCGEKSSKSDSAKTESAQTDAKSQSAAPAQPTGPGPSSPAPVNPIVANPEDAPKLITEAEALARAGDLKGALAKVESAVAAATADPKGLVLALRLSNAVGMQAAQAGDRKTSNPLFINAAKYIERLEGVGSAGSLGKGEAGSIYYNAGCAHAMAGESDKAIAVLEKAAAGGFNDIAQYEGDTDLVSLKSEPGFQALLTELRKKNEFSFDFTLKDLDGKEVSLSDFKGKVVIADIWGTWCPPCRKEIPHFIELQNQYGEAGLQIVGLNFKPTGQGEDVATVKPFADEFGINYPCLIGERSVIAQVPNLRGFPTTLFIDRNGKVRSKVVGYHTLSKLESIIKPMLAEKASSE